MHLVSTTPSPAKLKVYGERLVTVWNYTYRNMEIACIKKDMCPGLFSEETSCGSTQFKSLHFGFWLAAKAGIQPCPQAYPTEKSCAYLAHLGLSSNNKQVILAV